MLPQSTQMQRPAFTFEQVSPLPECCICLDVFTSPVSLPCGHRFCLQCIGEYWRIHEAFQCPLCKAVFPIRPHLKPHSTSQSQDSTAPLKAGEVPCDFCPSKRPAVKSCLACLASYCGNHLEPHYQDDELGRHPLISVVKNLEDSVCRLHGKRLDRFCRSDQTCICAMCVHTEHRGHRIVSISNEAAKTKVKLKRRGMKLQRMIEERLSEVKKAERSLDLRGKSLEEGWAQNERIKQLQEEIAELQRRNAEVEQLYQIEDGLKFLQRCLHSAF